MKLPRDKLLVLCNWPPVQRWVKDSDHLMFQSLVEVLIPDVLRPIPSKLMQDSLFLLSSLFLFLSTSHRLQEIRLGDQHGRSAQLVYNKRRL